MEHAITSPAEETPASVAKRLSDAVSIIEDVLHTLTIWRDDLETERDEADEALDRTNDRHDKLHDRLRTLCNKPVTDNHGNEIQSRVDERDALDEKVEEQIEKSDTRRTKLQEKRDLLHERFDQIDALLDGLDPDALRNFADDLEAYAAKAESLD